MFESYTEDAKLTILIAKSEAAKLGSLEIEPEHILLALLTDEDVKGRLMGGLSVTEIREDILAHALRREPLSTPVDLPLSAQSQEMLAFAKDEANGLADRYVSNSHMMHGLLRDRDSRIAQLLGVRGLLADKVRSQIGHQEDSRSAGLDESIGTSSLATEPPVPPALRSLMLATIPQVKELTRRGEQRRALRLLDDLMAESVPEKNLRIRHLAPLATATARSIGDLHLAKHYCEMRLANDSEDAMALYGMADCLVQEGNSNQAKAYVTKCYELSATRKDNVGQGIIELLQKRFPGIKLGS
jgi:hypothetical protein